VEEVIMITVKIHRPRAVAGAPKPNLALLAFVEKVEQKLTNNPNFPNVGTVLTELTAARTAFSAALGDKKTKKDVGQTATAARQVLIDKLGHAKNHVNSVAEQATPDQAKAIIESAGFRTRKVVVHTKVPLAAKYGGTSGSVLLVALAAGRNAVYYFEVSTDQKSWTSCPNVMKCRTTVAGLTVGTTYYFRFRAQTPKGVGDWSQVVDFVVR
jgi:hypothetical protein